MKFLSITPTVLNIESGAYLAEMIAAFVFSMFFFNYFYQLNIRPRIENWLYSDEIEEGKFERKIVKHIPQIMVILLSFTLVALVSTMFFRAESGRAVAGLAVGALSAAVIHLSILDIKYGEMYIFEESTVPFAVFCGAFIYNKIYGCDCLPKPILICFILWFLVLVLDNILNRQFNIGIADIDNLSAIFILTGGITMTMSTNNMEFEAMGFVITVAELFIVNMIAYVVAVMVIRKIRKEKVRGKVRALPAFILPYMFVIFTLFSVYK